MPSLKKRFPIYSRALRLYPKPYRRQYANQMLQTMADMLDNRGDKSRLAKAKIWRRIVVDLFQSLPDEYLRLLNPRTYVMKSLVFAIILVLPMFGSLIYQLLIGRNAILPPEPPLVWQVWYSSLGLLVWGLVMSAVATIIAIVAIIVWCKNRHQNTKKQRKIPRLAMAGVISVSITGLTFIGFVVVSWQIGERQNRRQFTAARQYQQNNPSLACTLLPEAYVQDILGKDVHMVGDNERIVDLGYSSCQYPHKDYVLYVAVQKGTTQEAVDRMHRDLQALDYPGGGSIKVKGYEGIYSYYGDKNYSLNIWVKDHEINVSAESFATAHQIMSVMIKNLENKIINDENSAPSPIPNALKDLSEFDQKNIADAVQGKEASIPAGVTYNVDFLELSGGRISGVIRYSNGVKANFSVEKKRSGWLVTSYKRS